MDKVNDNINTKIADVKLQSSNDIKIPHSYPGAFANHSSRCMCMFKYVNSQKMKKKLNSTQ